jgi:DNA primase catalytic core
MDTTWGVFLVRNDALFGHVAEAVRRPAHDWRPDTAPHWARPLVARHPALVAAIAQWRTARGVPDSEPIPHGPRPATLSKQVRDTWDHLDHDLRVATGAAVFNRHGDLVRAGRWDHLVPREVSTDPLWPVVVARLTDAAERGADIEDAIGLALRTGRLPDEDPAAAIWFRLAPIVPPDSQPPTDTTVRRRPAWTDTLLGALPAPLHHGVVNDPAWPRLDAAVAAIPPDQIADTLTLAASVALAKDLPYDALTTELAAQIETIAQPPDDDPPEPETEPDWRPAVAGTPATDAPSMIEQEDPERFVSERDLEPAEETQPAGTSPARLRRLTEAAADFYAASYPGSRSATYIKERLGTDLTDDSRWWIGHAPAAWTALTDHLTVAEAATPQELVDAGLSRWTRRGTLIDVFRDRVLFGVTEPDGRIAGFSGRALPGSHADAPKYINTPTTAIYHKGQALFGASLLNPGTTAVLTEGPIDAIAVTLAGQPRQPWETPAVGVAPCGTALTQDQVRLIAPAIHGRTMIVATDADPAGWKAAERDFHRLAPTGTDQRRLHIIGEDPAAMWADRPDQLHQFVTAPDTMPGLATELVRHHAADLAARNQAPQAHRDPAQLDPATGLDGNQTIRLARHAAGLIADLPRHRRAHEAQAIAERLGRTPADLLAAAEELDPPNTHRTEPAPADATAERLRQATARLAAAKDRRAQLEAASANRRHHDHRHDDEMGHDDPEIGLR